MTNRMTYEDGTRIVALIERLIGGQEQQEADIAALQKENIRLRRAMAYREKSWEQEEVVFTILRTEMGHYCGYVTFPKRFLLEDGHEGILTYAPVHGGITLAERDDETGEMTYGFDCMHVGDDENPLRRDLDWLTAECERMAVAIRMAQEYEKQYLQADGNEARVEIIDTYHERLHEEHGIEFYVQDNFGAMLSVMGGKL